MSKKTITLRSHGPHQYQHMKDIPVSWEDVWIELHQYHSRKKIVKLAPCFCSYNSLLGDIEICKDVADKFPEVKEELDVLNKIKEHLDSGRPYGYNKQDKDFETLPTIYVNKKELVRNDLQEAIEWLLIYRKLITRKTKLRFDWRKSKFIVWPA